MEKNRNRPPQMPSYAELLAEVAATQTRCYPTATAKSNFLSLNKGWEDGNAG
jgi:hypothetical protein